MPNTKSPAADSLTADVHTAIAQKKMARLDGFPVGPSLAAAEQTVLLQRAMAEGRGASAREALAEARLREGRPLRAVEENAVLRDHLAE